MYTAEKIEGDKFKVKISLTAQEWNEYVNQAYEQNKGKFSVQGFRKGKVPKKVIEQNYGADIFFDDALQLAFSKEYGDMLAKETEIEPVDHPDVSLEKFDSDGLVLNVTVQSMPEVKLGKYKGLEIESAKGEVEEKQVEKELNQVRERNARYVEVQREAKLGDFVTIDFSGSIDGVKFPGGEAKDYRLELGSKSFIEGFEEQIVGMKIGETKTIKVTFPENYHAEELKGKPADFEITLKGVEEKQLPELNDEFASNVSEFETLDEYKKDIRKHLEETLNERLERETENNIIKAVVKEAEVNIPECMVESQLDAYMKDMETRLAYQGLKLDDYCKYMNTTPENIRKENHDHALETVKTRLAIEKIIEVENLKVTDEELDSKLEEVAKKYNKTAGDYKKSLGEKQLIYFENDILMDKLVKFLKENNKLI